MCSGRTFGARKKSRSGSRPDEKRSPSPAARKSGEKKNQEAEERRKRTPSKKPSPSIPKLPAGTRLSTAEMGREDEWEAEKEPANDINDDPAGIEWRGFQQQLKGGEEDHGLGEEAEMGMEDGPKTSSLAPEIKAKIKAITEAARFRKRQHQQFGQGDDGRGSVSLNLKKRDLRTGRPPLP